MAETVDFQSVMGEMTQFQDAIGKIHEGLHNAKHKEILGAVIDSLQRSRADVEVEYPKAMSLIEETARSARAEAQQELAQVDEKRAQAEQRKADLLAAQQKASQAPAQPEMKVDPNLGARLRAELLERFGRENDSDTIGKNRIREAWQDWD